MRYSTSILYASTGDIVSYLYIKLYENKNPFKVRRSTLLKIASLCNKPMVYHHASPMRLLALAFCPGAIVLVQLVVLEKPCGFSAADGPNGTWHRHMTGHVKVTNDWRITVYSHSSIWTFAGKCKRVMICIVSRNVRSTKRSQNARKVARKVSSPSRPRWATCKSISWRPVVFHPSLLVFLTKQSAKLSLGTGNVWSPLKLCPASEMSLIPATENVCIQRVSPNQKGFDLIILLLIYCYIHYILYIVLYLSVAAFYQHQHFDGTAPFQCWGGSFYPINLASNQSSQKNIPGAFFTSRNSSQFCIVLLFIINSSYIHHWLRAPSLAQGQHPVALSAARVGSPAWDSSFSRPVFLEIWQFESIQPIDQQICYFVCYYCKKKKKHP